MRPTHVGNAPNGSEVALPEGMLPIRWAIEAVQRTLHLPVGLGRALRPAFFV
jgi:hypothetical protein